MTTPATTHASLDVSTLKAFEHAAAGHEGALSDASGALFIKPSTQQEIDFYQTLNQNHPELAELVPTFIGTLSLGAPSELPNAAAEVVGNVGHDLAQHNPPNTELRAYGTRITTDIAIVLGNLEHGFKRPCVMDLKLGAKLCAPGTAPDKVARLDKVAAETTSRSLHFRIAGMKVWNGASYDIYDKRYGRTFSAETVNQGFATFFAPLATGLAPEYAQHMLTTCRDEIERIRTTLEELETRMFSSSVLIIYEGDMDALKATMVSVESDHDLENGKPNGVTEGDANLDDDDDDDDDEVIPMAYLVSLIDFAHATISAGEGSDTNVIPGLLNIERQLKMLIERI